MIMNFLVDENVSRSSKETYSVFHLRTKVQYPLIQHSYNFIENNYHKYWDYLYFEY
jgi:hypothetical protein